MRDRTDLKPIAFHQLCALLRSLLQSEPSIDDAEWKARAKDTLTKWKFHLPTPEQLDRAMSAVEQAMKQTVGPRPLRETPTPPVAATSAAEVPKEARTANPPGWDRVVRLMARLQQSVASAPLSPAPVEPSETLPVDEVTALNEFWQAAHREGANRLALLQAFAEIAIVRPEDWDYAAMREAQPGARLSAVNGCFVCSGEYAHWHHVIQIQFGGSDYVRNFVPLCAGCHSAIHPWLPVAPRTGRTRGWTQIGDMAAEVLGRIVRRAHIA